MRNHNTYTHARCTCRDFLDKTDVQPDRSQVAVFDIDETALSNRAEWLTGLQQASTLLDAQHY